MKQPGWPGLAWLELGASSFFSVALQPAPLLFLIIVSLVNLPHLKYK